MNFMQGGAAQSPAQNAIHLPGAKTENPLAIRGHAKSRASRAMPDGDPGKSQTQARQGFGASRPFASLHDMHGAFTNVPVMFTSKTETS
jgi:hypothetical protein